MGLYAAKNAVLVAARLNLGNSVGMTATTLQARNRDPTSQGVPVRRSPWVSSRRRTGRRQRIGRSSERSKSSPNRVRSCASGPAGTVSHPSTNSFSTARDPPYRDGRTTLLNSIRRPRRGQLIGPRRGQISSPFRGPKSVIPGGQLSVPLTGGTGMNKTGPVVAACGKPVEASSVLPNFGSSEVRNSRSSQLTDFGTANVRNFGRRWRK